MGIDILNSFIKCLLIYFSIFYVFIKITNCNSLSIKNNTMIIVFTIILSFLYTMCTNNLSFIVSNLICITIYAIFISLITKNNLGYALTLILLSLGITYGIFIFSTVICSFFKYLLFHSISYDNVFGIIFIAITQFILIYLIFRTRRLKNGISFVKNKEFINNFGIIGIICSGIILIIYTIIGNYSLNVSDNTGANVSIGTILLLIGIILWIKRQITLKYKHDELVRQLEEAEKNVEKEHLAKLKAEEENNKRAKIIHKFEDRINAAEESLQALANKLSTNMNTEFGEEISEVTEIIENLSKDLKNDKQKELSIEFAIPKTNIPGIDSIIQHYYNKARKNEIQLEFELKCNMNEFIQNTVEEEKIITLLKDHLQDAIIAINYSKEANKKIKLVIQKTDDNYEICVYDTGIEFEIDTLLKLGKEQITTHKDTGGSRNRFCNNL